MDFNTLVIFQCKWVARSSFSANSVYADSYFLNAEEFFWTELAKQVFKHFGKVQLGSDC